MSAILCLSFKTMSDLCCVSHKVCLRSLIQDVEDPEETFITEVFSGCVRHAKIMKVIIDGFYIKDGKSCLRSDINLYTGN